MYESSSTPHKPLLSQLLGVLAHTPAGLFTDVDGTISPIAAQPQLASVLKEARRALVDLRPHLAIVGVVSGRPVANLRTFVGEPGLAYVGNHGFEQLRDGQTVLASEARPWQPIVQQAASELAPLLVSPGISVENKGITLSLHYRLAPDREAAHAHILAAIAASPVASQLVTESGRMVVNLLPPVPISKGVALRLLAIAHGLRGLVYFGDDLTDVTAFEALADLRSEGVATLTVAVATPEALPEVAAAADVTLASPHDVAQVLAALAQHYAGSRV